MHGAQAYTRPDTWGRGTMPSPAAPSALAPRLHKEFSNFRLFLQDSRGLFLQLLKVIVGNVTSFLRTCDTHAHTLAHTCTSSHSCTRAHALSLAHACPGWGRAPLPTRRCRTRVCPEEQNASLEARHAGLDGAGTHPETRVRWDLIMKMFPDNMTAPHPPTYVL